MLDTSVAAVNSSLQRARAQLDAGGADRGRPRRAHRPAAARAARPLRPRAGGQGHPGHRRRVHQPTPSGRCRRTARWYQGAEDIGRLIDINCPAGPGELRLLPTEANGQPAFAVYRRGTDGSWHAFQLQVMTVIGGRHLARHRVLRPEPVPDLRAAADAGRRRPAVLAYRRSHERPGRYVGALTGASPCWSAPWATPSAAWCSSRRRPWRTRRRARPGTCALCCCT